MMRPLKRAGAHARGGAHARAASGSRGGALTLGRLLRRHLRRVGLGVLLALVAALTTTLVLATPRLADAAYDKALGDQLRDSARGLRDINLSVTRGSEFGFYGVPIAMLGGEPVSPQERVDAKAREILGPAAALVGEGSFSAQADSSSVSILDDAGRPRTDQPTRQAVARLQSGFPEKVTWDAGEMPGLPRHTATVPYLIDGNQVPRPTRVIPVAITTRTADEWGIGVGTRMRLDAVGQGPSYAQPQPFVVEIAGTYTPKDAADPFWDAEQRMVRAAGLPSPDGGSIPEIALIVAPEAYGPFGAALYPLPEDYRDFQNGSSEISSGLVHEWRYPIADERVDRGDVDVLADGVSRLDLAGSRWGPDVPKVVTGLRDVLARYQRAVASTSALMLFIVLALVVGAALAMAQLALAIVGQRRRELGLLRTRGAAAGQVVRLTLSEIAIWLIPAVLAVAVVAALAPGRTRAESVALVVAPMLVVLIVAVVATLVVLRSAHRTGDRAGGRWARRLAIELTVLAGAYFVTSSLRSRGEQIRFGTADWVGALTPVLLALAATVVLLRIYPLLVTLAARGLARTRSLLGFLGLARSARDGTRVGLPVAILVVAATVTTLLTTIWVSIDRERVAGTYRSIGADVRIDAIRIDATDLPPLAGRAGVGAVVPGYLETTQLSATAGSGNQSVALVATDPQAYAAALDRTPVAFDPARLSGSAAGGDGSGSGGTTGSGDTTGSGSSGGTAVIPALVSAPLKAPGPDFQLAVDGVLVRIRVVGVDPALARGTSGKTAVPVVLVPLATLQAVKPSTQPNTVFLQTTDAAAAELAGSSAPTKLSQGVTSRPSLENAIAERALPRLVQRGSLAALVAAGLLSLLAALQLLAATRRERTDAMVRLRTMGLRHGGEWRLGLIEVLPLAAAAIAAGVGSGLVIPRFLTSFVDLSHYTGGPPFPRLGASLPTTAALAGALLAIVVLALAVDARRARRTRLAEHLRAGDTR